MSSSPLALYVFPVNKITVQDAGNGSTLVKHYKVMDAGSRPMTVTMAPVTLTQGAHHACTASAAPAWITMSPKSLALMPDRPRTVTTVVHMPAGTIPTIDLGASFTAVGKGKGNVTVSGQVRTQIVIQGTGHAPVCNPPEALPVASSSGFPVLPLALALAAVFGIIAGLAFTLRRRRRRPFERHHTY